MSENQTDKPKTCDTCAFLCLRPVQGIFPIPNKYEPIYQSAMEYVRADPNKYMDDHKQHEKISDLLRVCTVNCGLGWTTNLTPAEVHNFGCIRHSELTNIVITKKLQHTEL